MVSLDTLIAVFTLVPACLATVLPPADASPLDSRRALIDGHGDRWLPRARGLANSEQRLSRRGGKEGPALLYREHIPLESRSRLAVQRRSLDNGSIIDLGIAHSTYVIPVILGSPPVAYPLQLDLGSSDLLLASILCGDKCPASVGQTVNPYYDAERYSSTFESVGENTTRWQVGYADGRTAEGFLARENVSIGNSRVPGQVFGLIDATNLTLAEQHISGIFGLGFPRLSTIARVLLRASTRDASSSSALPSSTASSVAAASAIPSTAPSIGYLPTYLESLVTAPHIPYPVFGLALAPPPIVVSSTTSTSSAAASPSARFSSSIGSLTLGGVSSLYVSEEAGSGLTRDDIEWHQVVPFRRVGEGGNDTSAEAMTALAGSGLSSADIASSTSSSPANSTSAMRKRQATSSSSASSTAATPSSDPSVPHSLDQLSSEEYLYWTIQLANVSVNGTDIALESTFASLDIPPIALLDAGFNGISGPISQVAKIFDNVPEARQSSTGQWVAPCDTKMTLGFSFGGRYIQLQPSDWMYASVADSSFCLAWPVGTGPASDGIDWQLGTPFLKKVYSVFSYGINGVQAPLVGFLPIPDTVSGIGSSSSPSASPSGSATSSILSSIPEVSPHGPTPTTIIGYKATATVATNLPNAVLPVPSYSAPSYIYDHDPAITPGVLQTIGLANASAYSVTEVPILIAPNMSDATSSRSGTVGIGGSNTDSSQQGAAGVASEWGWGVLVGGLGVAYAVELAAAA